MKMRIEMEVDVDENSTRGILDCIDQYYSHLSDDQFNVLVGHLIGLGSMHQVVDIATYCSRVNEANLRAIEDMVIRSKDRGLIDRLINLTAYYEDVHFNVDRLKKMLTML